ncbi:MAG: hypothetical protein KDK91_33775, partial [Gammaproteobacteria bacterium]|nr:hypothetical protein [Gammaproteobacteria bacterium]
MSERHENPASVSGTDQAQRPTRQLTGDGSDRAGGRRSVAGERDSGLAAGHPPASVARALCDGEHADPFALLGAHRCSDGWCVRALGLDADELALELEDASRVPMQRVDATSLFVASGLEQRPARYRLWSRNQGGTWCHEDPYRFSSPLGPLDLHLMAEGTHLELYERFGARLLRHEGVEGVHFCVWAPNARRVSVVGPFNGWDGRRHVMRQHPGAGVWDLFVPGLHAGELYKFEILAANGRLLPLKADPFARRMEPPPGNACIVEQDEHVWGDAAWMAQRPAQSGRDRPVAIYEVHVGSWRRHQPDGRPYSYDELAESLIPYVLKMGFTHIELLP